MKAGTAGGIDTAVKVINIQVENIDACFAGCGALYNMTLSNCKSTNLTNTKNKEQLRTK